MNDSDNLLLLINKLETIVSRMEESLEKSHPVLSQMNHSRLFLDDDWKDGLYVVKQGEQYVVRTATQIGHAMLDQYESRRVVQDGLGWILQGKQADQDWQNILPGKVVAKDEVEAYRKLCKILAKTTRLYPLPLYFGHLVSTYETVENLSSYFRKYRDNYKNPLELINNYDPLNLNPPSLLTWDRINATFEMFKIWLKSTEARDILADKVEEFSKMEQRQFNRLVLDECNRLGISYPTNWY